MKGEGVLAFQFHKGTIKTPQGAHLLCMMQNFNSIKVRLKQLRMSNFSFFQLYFNSIKVRLKLSFSLSSTSNSIISIP